MYGPPAALRPLMDCLFEAALAPHANARSTRWARRALYVRGHWLKMPIPLLAWHLTVKAFRREEMPASRYHANRIGSRALSGFMGVHLGDSQCGYRLFRTDLVRRMKLRATGYDIETEMLVKLGRLGGRIEHVPVTAVYGAKSKLRPVRDTTRTCFRAVYYRFIEPV